MRYNNCFAKPWKYNDLSSYHAWASNELLMSSCRIVSPSRLVDNSACYKPLLDQLSLLTSSAGSAQWPIEVYLNSEWFISFQMFPQVFSRYPQYPLASFHTALQNGPFGLLIDRTQRWCFSSSLFVKVSQRLHGIFYSRYSLFLWPFSIANCQVTRRNILY